MDVKISNETIKKVIQMNNKFNHKTSHNIKTQYLNTIECFTGILGLSIQITDYLTYRKNCYETQQFNIILRSINSILTITLITAIFLSSYINYQFEKDKTQVMFQKKYYQTNYFTQFLIEFMICIVHSPPIDYLDIIYEHKFLDIQKYKFILFGEITNFMFLRLYLFIKLLYMFSVYNNEYCLEEFENEGSQLSSSFIFKSFMIDKPILAISFIMILFALVFGYLIGYYESLYYENLPECSDKSIQNLELYNNSIWLIFITMTTIGYGDYYPVTLQGRCIAVIAAFVGIFLNQLFIVQVSKITSFNYRETNTYNLLYRLKIREEIKQLWIIKRQKAASLITQFFRQIFILKYINDSYYSIKRSKLLDDLQVKIKQFKNEMNQIPKFVQNQQETMLQIQDMINFRYKMNKVKMMEVQNQRVKFNHLEQNIISLLFLRIINQTVRSQFRFYYKFRIIASLIITVIYFKLLQIFKITTYEYLRQFLSLEKLSQKKQVYFQKEQIGQKLDDFKILKKLGTGSYGQIYKVLSLMNHQEYALKIIQIQNKLTEQVCKESELLKKIKHKNIIKYLGSFSDQKNHYIIMEYAEKGDLNQIIKQKKIQNETFQENEIWNLSWQLMQALNYLHDQKIIHCDLKSSNVFMTKENNIKIGDFGLSKKYNELKYEKRGGTPIFLPPELIYKKNYDEKIDVWGLGCVLFHLSQLQLPFQGESFDEVSQEILTKQLSISNYSDELKDFILQMLEKNPQKRPTIKKIQKDFPKEIFKQIYLDNYQNESSRREKKNPTCNNFFKEQKIGQIDKKQGLQDKKQEMQSILDKNEIIKNIYMQKKVIPDKPKNIQIINQQIIYQNNFYQINNISNTFNYNMNAQNQFDEFGTKQEIQKESPQQEKSNNIRIKQINNIQANIEEQVQDDSNMLFDKQRSKTSQGQTRIKIIQQNTQYEAQFQECDKEYEQNKILQPKINSCRLTKFQIKSKQPFQQTQNNFFKPIVQKPRILPIQDQIFQTQKNIVQNSKFKFTIQDLMDQE